MATLLTPEIVRHAVPGAVVKTVSSKRKLIDAILERGIPTGAIVQIDRYDAERAAFFESATRHFPFLPILLLAPGGITPCADSICCVDSTRPLAEIGAEITRVFSDEAPTDRRRSNRFEWPIRARIDDGAIHEVTEISAGGAFLEPRGPIGDTGQERRIELMFQNFTITTTCEILDSRYVSSRKQTGFRVRFLSLSERAQVFIDKVVNDALVQVLLDPSSEPAMPTLAEDDLVLEFASEFALTD